jgi:hypothetical protein
MDDQNALRVLCFEVTLAQGLWTGCMLRSLPDRDFGKSSAVGALKEDQHQAAKDL